VKEEVKFILVGDNTNKRRIKTKLETPLFERSFKCQYELVKTVGLM
jgi:hypothetical protein